MGRSGRNAVAAMVLGAVSGLPGAVWAQQSGAAAPAPAVAPAVVTAASAKPGETFTVPVGTKILLAMESAVNTKTAKPGDGVYLISKFPVIVNGHVLIPPGVYVQGVVDQVERPGRVKGRAKLLMHFTTMIFPNGQAVTIPGGVDNLPGSGGAQVKNSEGQIEQAGTNGKDAATVAKGAGAGVGVGSIAGAAAGHPFEGIGYGALAGAAAGAISTLFTRGADIIIPVNTPVEMTLQRPLVLEASQLQGLPDENGRPQFVPSAMQQQPLTKQTSTLTPCTPGELGCD